MGDFFNSLLRPIELLVAWIMYGFHQVFTSLGLDPASGLAWGLSIIGLVLVMRAAMIPLFILTTIRNMVHGVIPAPAALTRGLTAWVGPIIVIIYLAVATSVFLRFIHVFT